MEYQLSKTIQLGSAWRRNPTMTKKIPMAASHLWDIRSTQYSTQGVKAPTKMALPAKVKPNFQGWTI
jgi:hypothetical protein